MLNAEESVLIVIDAQGKLARVVENSEFALGQIQKMILGAQTLKVPIILTAQVPEKLGSTVPEIAELLSDHEEISRTAFSAYREVQLMVKLSEMGRTQVLLCGFEAHICLYQTALDLLGAGCEVFYVVDAISSRFAHNKDIAIAQVAASGIKLTTVEMALFEMLRDAQHPAFKSIAKIIK